MAIAILLPATFSLDPLVGLTMLLGIYGSAMYGGRDPGSADQHAGNSGERTYHL
ncbi:MAG: tripartite tricarboxylate transporter permease [Nitratireductor sp.]